MHSASTKLFCQSFYEASTSEHNLFDNTDIDNILKTTRKLTRLSAALSIIPLTLSFYQIYFLKKQYMVHELAKIKKETVH